MFRYLACLTLTAYATNVSAAAAVIDFATGSPGLSGTIDDVNGDGSWISGSSINTGQMEAVGTNELIRSSN